MQRGRVRLPKISNIRQCINAQGGRGQRGLFLLQKGDQFGVDIAGGRVSGADIGIRTSRREIEIE